MFKTKRMVLLLLCALLALSGIAAAEEAGLTHQDVIDQWTQLMLDRAEEYKPQVRTLENGVQIQRTPTEYKIVSAQNVPGGVRSWNNKYLESDRRGCGACHTDFHELLSVENLEYVHCDLQTELNVPITYNTCYYCHTYISNMYLVSNWRDLIHGAHSSTNKAFAALGGDCWSCHYADEGGEMQIWDKVKYDVLWGIEPIANDAMNAEFVYDQEYCGSQDSMFTMAWFITHHYGPQYADENYERLTAAVRDVEPDLSLYDTWTLEVRGLVDNPTEFTVAELIEKFPSVTFKGSSQCIDNPVGGPYITQVEMTGISVRDIFEFVGLQDEAIGFDFDGEGETFEFMDNHGDAYVVYQIDGKPLAADIGFPIISFLPGMPADHHQRQIKTLTATADAPEAYEPSNNYWVVGAKPWFPERITTPNVGFMDIEEGTIIEAYEPYTIEGWADAFHDNIAAIEFSMDNGETWMHYDTSDTKSGRWVHWTFTFTPPEEAAYTIMVRSVNERGEATPEPVITMVNAKVL